jgi:pimeloyl-ACP methyl ester carboxylesterase
MRRAFVTLSGAKRQVHYRFAGSGAPLVLLHATPDSSAALDLTDSARSLIALDIPGYGESDPLAVTEPSLSDYAAALDEAFDAVD